MVVRQRPLLSVLVLAILASSLVVYCFRDERRSGDGVIGSPGPVPAPTDGLDSDEGKQPFRTRAMQTLRTFTIAILAEDVLGVPCVGVAFKLRCSDLAAGPSGSWRTSAITGEDGRVVTNALERGTWRVMLDDPSWTFADGVVPLASPRTEDACVSLRIVLARRVARFSGTLRTWTGLPVAGARLTASGASVLMAGHTDDAGRFVLEPSPESLGRVVEVVEVVEVDAEGHRLHGRWPIQADVDHEILLPQPASVTVRMTDHLGNPRREFSVGITSLFPHDSPSVRIIEGKMETNTTNADVRRTVTGIITVESLAPGPYWIWSVAQGAGDVGEQVALSAGEIRTLTLREPPRARWRVVDHETNVPVAGATVRSGVLLSGRAERATWLNPGELNAQTYRLPGGVVLTIEDRLVDEHGAVELAVPEDNETYVLSARATRYTSVVVAAREVVDRTVRVPRTAAITGQILGWPDFRQRMGLTDARLIAWLLPERRERIPHRDGGYFSPAQPLGADGKFELSGIHAGIWEYVIMASNAAVPLGTFAFPASEPLLIDAGALRCTNVSFEIQADYPLSGASVGVLELEGFPYATRWLPVRQGRTESITLLQGRVGLVVRAPDSAVEQIWSSTVAILGTEMVEKVRLTYREAVIEFAPQYEGMSVGISATRDGDVQSQDCKLSVRHGAVRVIWAPSSPFYVKSCGMGAAGSVFGPFALGQNLAGRFQAH